MSKQTIQIKVAFPATCTDAKCVGDVLQVTVLCDIDSAFHFVVAVVPCSFVLLLLLLLLHLLLLLLLPLLLLLAIP